MGEDSHPGGISRLPFAAVPAPAVVRYRLPSEVTTPWPANNNIPFVYYYPPPQARPAPAVIVLHGYGLSKESFLSVGPHLGRAGYAGLLLDLPFYGERRALEPHSGVHFPFGGNLELYVQAVRQMVSDMRQTVAWLRARREVDGRRLAVIGFSFGGVLCSLLMGMRLGLSAGAALMAAGDWVDLIYGSPLGAGLLDDLRRAGVTRERARRAFEGLTASTYAPWVENLLIVAGRQDTLVLPQVIETFWSGLDHNANRLLWKNSGHVPPVRATAREVSRFLREKLGPAHSCGEGSAPPNGRIPYLYLARHRLPLPPLGRLPVTL